MPPKDEKTKTTPSKRFGRYFGRDNSNDARPTDYSQDPKFNKAAAVRQEFDFYDRMIKMNKKKVLDSVLDCGEQARKVRGYGKSTG